jgi:hypothetical protein
MSRFPILFGAFVLASFFAPCVAGAEDSKPIIARLVGLALVADPKDVIASGSPGVAGVQIKGLPLLEDGGMKEKLGSYLDRRRDVRRDGRRRDGTEVAVGDRQWSYDH